AIEWIARECPPLRGVVHAAGVLDDGLIGNLDRSRFELVFKPKVAGAWHLHRLLADTPLDWCVLFSSIASLTGSVGQGNYAAANAFLDAMSQERAPAGWQAVTINWGPWAGPGLTERMTPGHRRGMGVDGGHATSL